MTTEELDRERLEMDIVLLECAQLSPGLSDACFKAIDRAIERLRAELAKLDGPAPGFVRVRVGVAVYRRGLWVAYGGHGESDESIVRDQLLAEPGYSISWITADVPLPSQAEIEGKVET